MFFDSLIPISEKNIVISDFFIILGNIGWIIKSPGLWLSCAHPLRRINRGIWALACAGILSGLTEIGSGTAIFSLLGAAQIAFLAVFLNPLICLECRNPTVKWISLALIGALLGVAGALSICEKIGVTTIRSDHYYRIVNPMIGVNRFYLVGIFAVFNLMALVLYVQTRQLLKAAVVLSFGLFGTSGLYLAQVRSGYILFAMSLLLIGLVFFLLDGLRNYFAFRIRKIGAFISLLLFFLLVGLLFYSVSGDGETGTRVLAEERGGLIDDDSRSVLVRQAFDSFMSNPTGFGKGLGKGKIDLGVGEPQNVHNVYVQSIYEMGFVGGAAITVLVFEFVMAAYLQTKLVLIRSRNLLGAAINFDKPVNTTAFQLVTNLILEVSSVWIIIGTLLIIFNVYPIGYLRFDWVTLLIGAQSAVGKIPK